MKICERFSHPYLTRVGIGIWMCTHRPTWSYKANKLRLSVKWYRVYHMFENDTLCQTKLVHFNVLLSETLKWNMNKIFWFILSRTYRLYTLSVKRHQNLRARSPIPVLGLTGRDRRRPGDRAGRGISGQNLRIKYIPSCVGTGTHLWITMPSKSTLSYTKSTYVNRND